MSVISKVTYQLSSGPKVTMFATDGLLSFVSVVGPTFRSYWINYTHFKTLDNQKILNHNSQFAFAYLKTRYRPVLDEGSVISDIVIAQNRKVELKLPPDAPTIAPTEGLKTILTEAGLTWYVNNGKPSYVNLTLEPITRDKQTYSRQDGTTSLNTGILDIQTTLISFRGTTVETKLTVETSGINIHASSAFEMFEAEQKTGTRSVSWEAPSDIPKQRTIFDKKESKDVKKKST